ncbi:hypothetical protein LCGC14_2889040 [marine sediment metagenome]|uniref:GIY-YIG domain-containing protein n=1 Tax=marine sediment metagenome TaxID=412755 RepID=A0A0F8YJP3_9ZZZZ
MIKIYALIDPTTNRIRYVGKTAQTLQKRLKEHLSPARLKKDSAKNVWLRSLKVRPVIVVLEECTKKEAEASEIFWIRLLKMTGNDLVNSTIGGNSWR